MGELKISDENVVTAKKFRDEKIEEESNALVARDAAKLHHDNKKKFLKAETIRIDNEKKVLEEVLTILSDLNNGGGDSGRRLLSADAKVFLATLLKQGLNVDPNALKDVTDAVNALIAKGEELREAAIKAESDADAAAQSAQSAYESAKRHHQNAQTELEKREGKAAKYAEEVRVARIEHTARTNVKALADQKEADLLATKLSEEARVTDENNSFEQVKDVLIGLL